MNLLSFFETISPNARLTIYISGFILMFLLEGVISRSNYGRGNWPNTRTNLILTSIQAGMNLIMAIAMGATAFFVTESGIGLWHWLEISTIWKMLISLLLMDLIAAYSMHRLEHKFSWMWKFHIVHHTDQSLGVTTAQRHHPVNSVFRITATLTAIVVTGAPLGMVMLYQTLSAMMSQINHANIKLPELIERPLSYILATPMFHKFHHHYKAPETDSNFGNIFSIWDWIFGTAKLPKNQDFLQYGVDTAMDPNLSVSTIGLLKLPFRKS